MSRFFRDAAALMTAGSSRTCIVAPNSIVDGTLLMKSLPRVRHERLQVSELQARVAELEEELAGARTTEVSDDHVVVGQPGLEDIRNAYAETTSSPQVRAPEGDEGAC